jgi:hypothetical protein
MNRHAALGHVATLTLAGWSLISPPLGSDANGFWANFHAPLAQWVVIQSFDRAQDCHAYQAKMAMAKWPTGVPMPPRDKAIGDAIRGDQCIASDDPRLAK